MFQVRFFWLFFWVNELQLYWLVLDLKGVLLLSFVEKVEDRRIAR